MLMKERKKSNTYLILESLNSRMNLTYEDKMNYQKQVKGFEGECLFDHHINHAKQKGLIINDLLLSTKNTFYQIDSILIMNQHLHIYEIKNYTGNYVYKDNHLVSESGYTIQNPINQVNRKKTYLHNLLLNMGYPYTISTFVSFMNPNFYIYSLPPTESILFQGQLNNYFDGLAQENKLLKPDKQDIELAKHLVSRHQEDYRSTHLPSYTFEDLKKGIICHRCFSFEFTKTKYTRCCTSCGYKESVTDAIYRSILELQLLFPEIKITSHTVQIWCGIIYSDYHICKALNLNFTRHSKGPKTFYT